MPAWAWYSYDVVSGRANGSIDLVDWSHEEAINESGAWTATLATAPDIATTRAVLNATAPARSLILATRTDDRGVVRPEFAGWVPPETLRPSLAGPGLLGYFDRRIIDVGLQYASVDQLAIAHDIVRRNPGALVDTSLVGTSGRLRDAGWWPWDGKNVGEALRDLAARIDGFDFTMRVEMEAGGLYRRMRSWYPRRGDVTGPRFTLGHNMLTAPAPSGKSQFATRIIALGVETDSVTRSRLAATRTTALVGFPLIDVKVDRTDISTQAALNETADGALRVATNQQDETLTFLVDPNDPTYPWGSWDLGDDCQVVVPPNRPPRIEVTPPVSGFAEFHGSAGNQITTPATPAFAIAGDLTVIARCSTDELAGIHRTIAAHYGSTVGWFLYKLNAGTLYFSSVNTTGTHALQATWPASAGVDVWVAATHVVDNGAAQSVLRLFKSPDGLAWTQIATSAVAAQGLRKVTTGPVTIGAINASNWYDGRVSDLSIRDGVGFNGAPGGAEVLGIHSADWPVDGATTFTAATGHTMTVARSGATPVKTTPEVPGYQTLTDVGEVGTPWWPDGLNEVRRIVAHKWSVGVEGERLTVTAGRRWEPSA